MEPKADMTGIWRKLALLSYTFVLMNWAAVAGLYNFARGRMDVWHSGGAAAR
jgi:hypothetical protein